MPPTEPGFLVPPSRAMRLAVLPGPGGFDAGQRGIVRFFRPVAAKTGGDGAFLGSSARSRLPAPRGIPSR